MTSYAELLQNCTEFQENFSILNGKHTIAVQELKLEREQVEVLQAKLEAAAKREDQQEQIIRSLKRDVDAAQHYKDRYLEASVALEHMKSRMESARQGVSDNALEHEQVVGQLRNQIKDLLQRIDVASDGSRMRDVKQQVVELEERCAVQTAQLHEEREKFSQQLLVAHNALREQQSHGLELEQRYRTIESELTEMRATVRRSADLQNEAAMIKEKYATEAAIAQREVLSLREDVNELNRKLSEAAQQRDDEMHAIQRVSAEEKHTLNARITTLTNSLNDTTASITAEREKYASLQRSVQQQVSQARDEASAEVVALRQTLSQLKEDSQRTEWRCQQLTEELAQSRRAVDNMKQRNEALVDDAQRMQRQLSAAAQQEAWLSAEKAHTVEELSAAEKKIEELTNVLKEHERISFEFERAKIKVRVQEEELVASQRSAHEYSTRMNDLEEAAEKRLRDIKREAKSYKKQLQLERATGDSLRRKLVHAVAECESERRRTYYPSSHHHNHSATAGEAMEPLRTLPHLATGAMPPSCDVISLLRQQNEQAEQLHTRLVELSH